MNILLAIYLICVVFSVLVFREMKIFIDGLYENNPSLKAEKETITENMKQSSGIQSKTMAKLLCICFILCPIINIIFPYIFLFHRDMFYQTVKNTINKYR